MELCVSSPLGSNLTNLVRVVVLNDNDYRRQICVCRCFMQHFLRDSFCGLSVPDDQTLSNCNVKKVNLPSYAV